MTRVSSLVALRPEEVPKDLICAICLSIPLIPSVTECSHVFCDDCITETFRHQTGFNKLCPVCRYDCTRTDSKFLEAESPVLYRIWCSITVKCEHHAQGCGWTGSPSDYTAHQRNCPRRNNMQLSSRDAEAIRSLTEKIRSLKEELQMQKAENEGLNFRLSGSATAKEAMETIIYHLEKKVNKLQHKIEEPIHNGRGGYAYDRNSVVNLTKLICQNLENKPASINATKIFECVKNIFSDLNRGYSDNPEHFYVDVRMLLGVCQASTWFTQNQKCRINEMALEKGWS